MDTFIRMIQSSGPHELRVELRETDGGEYKRAAYSDFGIADDVTYALRISGHTSDRNWLLLDALSGLDGKPFSTFDRDNDGAGTINCAQVANGGGW